MREFRIKLSDEDMRQLRENCYLLENEPNRSHTDADVLKHELSFIPMMDARFGEVIELPSLEVEEVKA